MEDGTQKLIKDEYYNKTNATELLIGRYSFKNTGRKDKTNKVIFKGGITKFDKCTYIKNQLIFERDIEGNLEMKENEEQAYWIKGSHEYKNMYAAIDSEEMRPPFYKDY
jgi:hypothetical protein